MGKRGRRRRKPQAPGQGNERRDVKPTAQPAQQEESGYQPGPAVAEALGAPRDDAPFVADVEAVPPSDRPSNTARLSSPAAAPPASPPPPAAPAPPVAPPQGAGNGFQPLTPAYVQAILLGAAPQMVSIRETLRGLSELRPEQVDGVPSDVLEILAAAKKLQVQVERKVIAVLAFLAPPEE